MRVRSPVTVDNSAAYHPDGIATRATTAFAPGTAELKAEAVRLAAARRAEGASPAQVGRELDVRSD